ncbi:5'-3' exonuclease [Blattabacterium cuenoti]|uniref:5'-3' exonuclease n=1 Tax=Blattabacterium cuenoti TaxID=1653831 RepID=UPI00163D2CD2|nr:5'-3' exonuclease H3TH domain-containing protein [Blattabacterium cuenoti]
MNPHKRLFLIDAYPLLYQSYYALIKRPLVTSLGINTSPIFNFIYFLIKILYEKKPKYMSVIFDDPTENFRKKEYAKYKSNRKKIPQAIVDSIPYLMKILKAFDISSLHSYYGYEADDIIGTITKKAEKKGYMIDIISMDKDFFQLVTKNVRIFIPPFKKNTSKIFGMKEIQKKFHLKHPKQFIDLLSMIGDPSDKIPGLPGVGKQNAKKFIKKYGSLENLLSSIQDLHGKMKENIEKNKNLGILSKRLVTIQTNVPCIDFNDQEFSIGNPKWEEIKKIFEKLEFHQLFKKASQYLRERNRC